MEATSLEVVRQSLKHRYKAQLSMASWRGYANLIQDRTNFVGDVVKGLNRKQIKLIMLDKAEQGEFDSLLMARDTNMSMGDHMRKREDQAK